jgi:hypothetical protein
MPGAGIVKENEAFASRVNYVRRFFPQSAHPVCVFLVGQISHTNVYLRERSFGKRSAALRMSQTP